MKHWIDWKSFILKGLPNIAKDRFSTEFIKALGIEKFDVLGFSLGGFVAQYLGVKYSEMVRKIIIVGTAPQGAKVLEGFYDLIGGGSQLSPFELFLYIFFTKSENSRSKGKKTIGSETAHLGIKTTLIEPNGFATDWAGASAVQTSSDIADYNPVRVAFAESRDNPDTLGKTGSYSRTCFKPYR